MSRRPKAKYDVEDGLSIMRSAVLQPSTTEEARALAEFLFTLLLPSDRWTVNQWVSRQLDCPYKPPYRWGYYPELKNIFRMDRSSRMNMFKDVFRTLDYGCTLRLFDFTNSVMASTEDLIQR